MRKEREFKDASKVYTCDCREGQTVRMEKTHAEGCVYRCPKCQQLWIYRIFRDHSFEKFVK